MLDQRIERAVRGAGRVPTTDESAVNAAITGKLTRRIRRRRAVTGVAIAAMLVTGVVASAAILTHDEHSDVRVTTDGGPAIAPPPKEPTNPGEARAAIAQALTNVGIPGLEPIAIDFVNAREATVLSTAYRGVRVRLDEDGWGLHPLTACRLLDPYTATVQCARLRPEILVNRRAGPTTPAQVIEIDPDAGYVRGPLAASGSTVWAAAYNRDDTRYVFPPSRLVAVDVASGEVDAQVDLQGEILSRAEGDRASWVVTHERNIDADRVEYRLKQIDGAGGVISHPIPPGEVPAGRVVAGAGGVWIPVRDGVLVFDPGSGALKHKIPLADQARRAVAVIGARAYVTELTAIREIDANRADAGSEIIVLGTPGALADMVLAGDSVWALDVSGEVVRLDTALGAIRARFAVVGPEATLHTAGDRVWVQTTLDLAPGGDVGRRSLGAEEAVLLLGDQGVTDTIVIAGLTDGAITLTADGDLLFTSGGDVYRARFQS